MEKKILLIIPAYNEAENIVHTADSVKEKGLDLIVINDGSTDATAQVCEDHNIPHINSILNLGIGGAVQTGYKYADIMGYDIAVQFDGDGQHNIEDLEKLLEPILNDEADFCIGSRFLEESQDGFKSTATRRMGIYVISSLIKWCSGKNISDPTSGFRACNRTIIEQFAAGYPLEYPEPESIMYLLKNDFNIKEVAVVMHERANGKSSIGSWKNIYYMINVCLSIWLMSISKKGGKLR